MYDIWYMYVYYIYIYNYTTDYFHVFPIIPGPCSPAIAMFSRQGTQCSLDPVGHPVNLEVHQPIANDGVPPEEHLNFHEAFMMSWHFTGFYGILGDFMGFYGIKNDVMELSWNFMVTSWNFYEISWHLRGFNGVQVISRWRELRMATQRLVSLLLSVFRSRGDRFGSAVRSCQSPLSSSVLKVFTRRWMPCKRSTAVPGYWGSTCAQMSQMSQAAHWSIDGALVFTVILHRFIDVNGRSAYEW